MDCCQLLMTTCPNPEVAKNIAQRLVESKLAACVNIVPSIESVYIWDNKIQHDIEVLLLIKSRRSVYAQIEALISQEHPYDVPELVALDIRNGMPNYLRWIESSIPVL